LELFFFFFLELGHHLTNPTFKILQCAHAINSQTWKKGIELIRAASKLSQILPFNVDAC
jgi:hypothetical protein